MKILQINVVYKKGSTGKIVYDIHKFLNEKGIESIVCYGRGLKIDEPYVYKTSSELLSKLNALKSSITGLQYDGSWIATYRLINIIKREKPDIVHLHCINGYFVSIYQLLDFLKNNKIKTVLTLHAEFMHTGNCGHAYECDKWMSGCGNCPKLWSSAKSYLLDRTHSAWEKMRITLEGFDNFIVVGVSQWILDRAKNSPIMKDKEFRLVYNGINTNLVFNKKYKEALNLRKKYKIQEYEHIILHVTPNFKDEIKGGKYFLSLANQMINEKCKFIIVGYNDSNITLPPNVITVTKTNDQNELAAYYTLADLLIITSLQDSYPTVCLESISCGTPVIGFDVGGIKETIKYGLGTVVTPFNVNELRATTQAWINRKNKIKANTFELARVDISKERMCEEYLSIYNSLYGGKKIDHTK